MDISLEQLGEVAYWPEDDLAATKRKASSRKAVRSAREK